MPVVPVGGRQTSGMVGNLPLTSFLIRPLLVQRNVIGALIMREVQTRFGRENIGFLWFIVEPILFCAGVAVAWTIIRPKYEHGLPVTAVVLTGYVPLTMWRHCIARAVKAFEANGSLLFHRHVTPLDIITARVLLEVAGTMAGGFLVVLGAMLLGFMEAPVDLGLLLLGLLYHMFYSYGCALLIASLSEKSELVEKSISVFIYLSLPFSGAFTMVSWVPKGFQQALLWSPAVHNLEMIRAGQFGAGVHPMYDLFYDTWVTALMVLVGMSLTLRVRRYILIQ